MRSFVVDKIVSVLGNFVVLVFFWFAGLSFDTGVVSVRFLGFASGV